MSAVAVKLFVTELALTGEQRLAGLLLATLAAVAGLMMLAVGLIVLRHWRRSVRRQRRVERAAASASVDAWSESGRRMAVATEAATEPSEDGPSQENRDDEEEDDDEDAAGSA